MSGHRHIPNCWMFVNSGVPPREPLYNGTLCRHHALGDGNFASRSFGREQVRFPALCMQMSRHNMLHSSSHSLVQVFSNVEVARPAVLPIISHRHSSRGYLCFLNSRGEVTAYHGRKIWQVVFQVFDAQTERDGPHEG